MNCQKIILLILILTIIFIKYLKNYRCRYFQHNEKYKITKKSYTYVKNYKKELIRNITKLLMDLNIKFSVSAGILLEYHRGEPIYQDDDVDVRFNYDDIDKWEKFCNSNNNKLEKYNLIFDHRFKDINRQKINGIQCSLINFNYNKKYKDMDIHLDLVPSKLSVKSEVWKEFNIDFNNLRKVKIYNVDTYIPSKKDTINYLILNYGKNYNKPHCLNKPF